MSDIIRVTNLSKSYILNHERQTYKSFRDEINAIFKKPFSANKTEKFYALKNVSFSIKEGETVGIIGSNGAGKSTLLKILSRITLPTKGEVYLKGRVSSLLEVGTGFHPELTGRENIFLNGAILGMSQKEVKRKFDEIVDFAEVEKFLDTPVKHFSSGMYMRLAFAVAAHLEPDVLIVDEVLAVGDAKFQKKCLGKMGEVGRQGRTVIFVSHNMAAINDLCKKSIYLDKGEIVEIGPTAHVITSYLSSDRASSNGTVDFRETKLRKNSLSNSSFTFSNLSLFNSNANATAVINSEESFYIEIEGIQRESVPDLTVGITILSNGLYPIYSSQITAKEMKLIEDYKKIYLKLSFDPNIFNTGIYTISLGANGKETIDWIPEALYFTIQKNDSEKVLESVYDAIVVYPRKWTVSYEN